MSKPLLYFLLSGALAGCSGMGEFWITSRLKNGSENQKKILLDSINLSLTEGDSAVISVSLADAYKTDTVIRLNLVDPVSRFEALPAQVTIEAGERTKNLVLESVDNGIYDGVANISLSIASDDADTVVDTNLDELSITLNDNDPMPSVQFSAASQSVFENAGNVTVTVVQSALSAVPTQVPVTIMGTSTATQGSDFTLAANSIWIPAGVTTANFTVAIVNDTTNESPGEVLNLQLGTLLNATAGAQTTHALNVNDDEVVSLTVASTYPNNSRWLEYVINNNGGTNEFDQPDSACLGTEMGAYTACIHGGEKRKVAVTGYSTCTGLTISDSLGVMDWICRVDAGVATFHTIALKLTAGLGDLINTDRTWKTNSVTVQYNGVTIGTSTPAAWWNNNLVAPPASTGNPSVITSGTNAAGDIIVINSNLSHSGFNINRDRIAMVVLPGFTLSYGGGLGCVWATGENKDGGSEEACAFAAGNQRFLWVEGSLDGSTGFGNLDMGVLFTNVRFSRVNRIYQRLGDDTGLGMVSSSSNKITNVRFENFGNWAGLYFEGSSDNLVIDVQVAQALHGVNLNSASNRNTFVNVRAYNAKSPSNNINLDASTDNTFTNVLSSGSGNAGFHVKNVSPRTTLNHYFSANEDDESIWAESSRITVNQAVIVNNGNGFGAISANGSDPLFSQIVVANGHDDGLEISSTNGRFTQNVLVGNFALLNCSVSGPSPGLTGACANAGASDANFIVGAAVNLSASFVGKVTTDDVANPSDTLGLRAFSQTLISWLLFDNPFRVWNKDGSSFPSLDNTDSCESGNCRIWDWRLRATDTVIRNKSGNGATANEAFVAGSNCPAAVNGNRAITDQNTSPRTFLVNATEILNDGYGNDNGLCESGEACIYSPNFGYYQGVGDYKAAGTCTFQNGVVTNVQMYAYPVNGT